MFCCTKIWCQDFIRECENLLLFDGVYDEALATGAWPKKHRHPDPYLRHRYVGFTGFDFAAATENDLPHEQQFLIGIRALTRCQKAKDFFKLLKSEKLSFTHLLTRFVEGDIWNRTLLALVFRQTDGKTYQGKIARTLSAQRF